MALTVGEDTYISVADTDTYWTEHPGGSNWTAAGDTDKEAALRQATQYVDKKYTWVGVHPGTLSQNLSWPRLDAIDRHGRTRTGTPQEVKDATAYMAEQVLADTGVLNPKDRGGQIKSVAAGSVNVEWEEGANSQKTYDYVDLLLKNITKGGKGVRPLLKV